MNLNTDKIWNYLNLVKIMVHHCDFRWNHVKVSIDVLYARIADLNLGEITIVLSEG